MSTRSRSRTSPSVELGRPPAPRPCTETGGLPLPTLLESTPAALAQLACILATRVELWRPLLHVDPDRRWYARVAGAEGWEAWLHTWLPGQSSGLHDHGGSAGAFTVLSGELAERVAVPGPELDTVRRLGEPRLFRSPDVRAFDRDHRHALTGAGGGPAASLHVYAPALRRDPAAR